MTDLPVLTAEFDFDLPPERIAQAPARPRDSARLLEVGPALHDRIVRDLPDILRPGDVMVFNDTRVIQARLSGRRGEAAVEVTLHLRLDDLRWRVFARPAKRLRPGDRIAFGADFAANVLERHEAGEFTLRFDTDDLPAALRRYGRMPLPPYIRQGGETESDRADYQTLYAAHDGAVAAPTAGLHFTPDLFAAIDRRGVTRTMVTLHVGAGTFLPVRTEVARDHRMYPEIGILSAEAARTVNDARAAGGRIVAVGSTATRLLESAAGPDGRVQPFHGTTDLFITPGYRFKAVDLMWTNFHLPRSTLFMMVSAFAGHARMKAAYAHAVAAGYRFYSYGDACLLHPADHG
ncbi:MAG: tRNA preQ1(34) S-adenosylmethionine ribosyltransferase-isomerase QueA [Alphaproteobacteria bacterium]